MPIRWPCAPGDWSALQKLIDSKELGSIELSTGLQVSGNFENVIAHRGKPVYFQTLGNTALAYREKELVGHGVERHSAGFGSPVGKLKGINLAIENMALRDLKAYNIYEGQTVTLQFEGGITVAGEIITGTRNLSGKIILVTFKDCTVRHNDKILFESKGDLYSMCVGEHIVSAFNGPADVDSFDLITHEISAASMKSKPSAEQTQLERYYEQVRHFREGKNTTISRHKVFAALKDEFPNDWLLSVELYELAATNGDSDFAEDIERHLESVKQNRPKVGHLIDDGVALVKGSLVV